MVAPRYARSGVSALLATYALQAEAGDSAKTQALLGDYLKVGKIDQVRERISTPALSLLLHLSSDNSNLFNAA